MTRSEAGEQPRDPGRGCVKPGVAIVVLCRNRRADVVACLQSIEALAHEPFDVVIVDNGSSDGSPGTIRERFPHYHLIECKTNVGAASGRNLGARYAEDNLKYRYFLFLDDDAEVTPTALSRCVEGFAARRDTGIICGKTFARLPSTTLMSTGLRVDLATASIFDIGAGETDRCQFDEPRDVDACGAFAFAIRRDLFLDLKGFDSRFDPYGWEEVDLCLRAQQLGFRTTYIPSAVFCHKGSRLGRPLVPAYEVSKARNFITLVREHATPRQRVACTFWLFYRAAALLWKAWRRGERLALPFHFKGIATALFRRPARGSPARISFQERDRREG